MGRTTALKYEKRRAIGSAAEQEWLRRFRQSHSCLEPAFALPGD